MYKWLHSVFDNCTYFIFSSNFLETKVKTVKKEEKTSYNYGIGEIMNFTIWQKNKITEH